MKVLIFMLRLVFMFGFMGLFLFGSAADSNFVAAIIGLAVSMFIMFVTAAVIGRIGGLEDD